MELLDRPVKRRPVDQRMVRGDRHPDHMAVLVLQRTAEVVVDLPEAQRERLGVRPAWGGGRAAPSGQRRPGAHRPTRPATIRSSRSRPDRAPRARTARPDARADRRSPRRDSGSARRARGSVRHRTGGAPRADDRCRRPGPRRASAVGIASGSRRPPDGNRPSTSPTMNTVGNSSPFARWTVSTATASESLSRSAVGGSSPASIRVRRWPATKAHRSSARSADWARTMSKKRATFWRASSDAGSSALACRASQPVSRRNA